MLNEDQSEFSSDLVEELKNRNWLLNQCSSCLIERACEGMELFRMSKKQCIDAMCELIIVNGGKVTTSDGEILALATKVEDGDKFITSATAQVPSECLEGLHDLHKILTGMEGKQEQNYVVFLLLFAAKMHELGYRVDDMNRDWAKSRVDGARKRDQSIGETLLEAMHDVVNSSDHKIVHEGEIMVAATKIEP